MLGRMSREQFDEWEAFDALEPLGTFRLFQTLSLIGSATYAAQGGEMKPIIFTPWLEGLQPEITTTAEQDIAVCRMAAAAANSGA